MDFGLDVSQLVVISALLAAFLWGVGPVLSKFGMEGGGNSTNGTLIILLGNAVIFWLVQGTISSGVTAIFRYPPTSVMIFATAGIVGTTFGWVFWFHGVDRLGASVSNIVYYMQPVFAVILAALFLQERLTPSIALGAGFIVTGITLLSYSESGDIEGWSNIDLLFPLTAAAFTAVGTVLNRYGFVTTEVGVLQAATIKTTSALVFLLGYFVIRNWRTIFRIGPEGKYFLLNSILSAVGVLLAYTALKNGPVVVVSPILGTAPLVTVTVSNYLLESYEQISIATVVSALLTLGGVALISVV